MNTTPFQGDSRFRILRPIGAGGMGVVYEAFDTRRGFSVALKTASNLSPEGILQLKREFRVASQLRHPNLVRFYDLVVAPEHCFFTMELLEGRSLLSYIRDGDQDAHTINNTDQNTGPVSSGAAPVWVNDGTVGFHLQRLLSSLSQVCAALDFLHQSGTVHRDIKPSNIVVSRDGRVKILDFGISRSTSLVEVGDAGITGTPHYISPEQIRGRAIPASDLYSLGVVLYYLLTGAYPFQGKTAREILEKHLTQTPVAPSTLSDKIPKALEVLCLLLLDKAPERRSTARDVLQYLVLCGAPPITIERRSLIFVGRQREFALLQESASKVLSGESRAVFISGESGLGKSALCREFIRTLPVKAWRVISGRCYEREQLSYNAVDPLIDAVALSLSTQTAQPITLPEGFAHAAAMFPVLRGLAPQLTPLDPSLVQRRQAIEALCALFEQVRNGRGLLVYLDDLQWADEESALLLEELLTQGSFLFLGTYRDLGATHLAHLQHLLQREQTTALSLPRLGRAEVQQLLGDQASEEVVDWVLQETRGNALFASELSMVFANRQSGVLDLNQLLLSRLASLSATARLVMELVVVAGASVHFDALTDLTHQTPAILADAIDQLLGERWLREVEGRHSGEQYDTYHDRIRELLYREMPDARRRETHALFAKRSLDEGEVERAANHMHKAERFNEAAPLFVKAAEAAIAQLALLHGAQLYRQALSVGGLSPEQTRDVREALATTLERIGGRSQEAADVLREAARDADPINAVRLLLRAARAELRRGDVDAALESARQAVAPVEDLRIPGSQVQTLAETAARSVYVEWRLRSLRDLPNRQPSDSSNLKHMLYNRLAISMAYFDLYLSGLLSMRAFTIALQSGSNEQLVDCMGFYSLFISFRRNRKSIALSQSLHAKSKRWMTDSHDLEIRFGWELIGGMISQAAGEFDLSIRTIQDVLERYRAGGFLDTPEVLLAHAFLLGSSTYGGKPSLHVEEARALHARGIESKDQIIVYNIAPIYSFNRIWMGQYDEARYVLSTMPKHVGRASVFVSSAEINRAMLHLAEGDPSAASNLLEEILHRPLQSGLLLNAEHRYRAHLTLALCYISMAMKAPQPSRRASLLQEAHANVAKLVSSDDPVFEGVGLRIQGLIAHARGQRSLALDLLTRAISSLSLRGETPELASALIIRGIVSGSSFDVERGNTLYSSAGYINPIAREGLDWL